MNDNFATCLSSVLIHEGGYVNDPQDPGGATNKGITQRVYDDWRASLGQPARSVRAIEQGEVEAIYRKQYWDAVAGDQLPEGLDYCLFDFAVNSGANRAARFLQRCLNLDEDGKIGPVTLAAVANANVPELIGEICDARLHFLMGLPTFPRFGRGWSARVAEVRADAEIMAT
jgi:lysozyme family protein